MAKKKSITAMPFDTGDWLRCPEVKILKPDVRGLWFDLLCYLWESVERGVMVKPNHEPYSRDEIVLLIGLDCSNSGNWLETLIENDVCSVRESDGAIFSRRMVRDYDISQKRSQAGKLGGDKTKNRLVSVPPKKEEPVPVEAPVPTPPPLTQKEKEKLEKAKKYKYAEFVSLTKDEYMKLVELHTEDGAKRIIEILNTYKGSSGRKYKSDYYTIKNWVENKYNEEIRRNGQGNRTTSPGDSGETNKQHTYRDTF